MHSQDHEKNKKTHLTATVRAMYIVNAFLRLLLLRKIVTTHACGVQNNIEVAFFPLEGTREDKAMNPAILGK